MSPTPARPIRAGLAAALLIAGCGSTRSTSASRASSTTSAPTTSAAAVATDGVTSPSQPPPTAAVPSGVEPRADLTPGVADPRVTQATIGSTICVAGYTRTVRPPESVTGPIKTRVLAAYGYTHPRSDYELDHLIPLEVGGAPADVGNLWPEPYESSGDRLAPPAMGSETKDRFENFLHREVCAGRLPLAVAQHQIATDWYGSWVAAGRP